MLQYTQDTRKTIECLSKLVTLKKKTRKKTQFPPRPSLPTTERKQEQSRRQKERKSKNGVQTE